MMRYITYLLNVVLFTTLTCVIIACGNNKSKSETDIAEDTGSDFCVEVCESVEAVDSASVDTVRTHEQEEERMESEVRSLMLGGHKLKGRQMFYNKPMDAVFTFYNDKTMTVNMSQNDDSLQGNGYWKKKTGSYHDVEYEWCELRYRIAGEDACAILDSKLRLYGPIFNDEADKFDMAALCEIMDDKSHPKYEIIKKFITPLEIVE